MNIAIIGSGGREHAICQKIAESKRINRIFCIPGNAGTSQIATNIDLDYLAQIEINVNPLLSTQLIFQLIYDDNAISRLQVREVFGVGVQLKLN